MGFELLERYIYAVVRRLPQKQRADVEKELRSLISDMLERRCGEVPPTEHDVRVVLTELGTPGELAGKYDTDACGALIGQPYYGPYKRVLKIVLLAAGGGMLLACALSFFTAGGAKNPFAAIAQCLGSVIGAEIYAFAFVTALFAFFERRHVRLGEEDSLNNLPPVPAKQERFKRAELIAGIVFGAVFLLVFLLAGPSFIGYYGPGGYVPMLGAAAVAGAWPLLAGACALGIAKDAVRMAEGRYTWRLAWATLGAGVATLALMAAFLFTQGLINPAFVSAMAGLAGEGNSVARELFSNFPRLFFGLFCFAVALDILTAFLKAAKAGE